MRGISQEKVTGVLDLVRLEASWRREWRGMLRFWEMAVLYADIVSGEAESFSRRATTARHNQQGE